MSKSISQSLLSCFNYLLINHPEFASSAKQLLDRFIDPEPLYPRFKNLRLSRDMFLREDNKDLESIFDGRFSICVLTDAEVADDLKRYKSISTTIGMGTEEIKNTIFLVYFYSDWTAPPEIRNIAKHDGRYIPLQRYDKTSYRFVNPRCLRALARTVKKMENISHYSHSIHENICEAIELSKNVQGDFVEVGVYKGGSALTALNMLQEISYDSHDEPQKFSWLIDTFDGFSYEAARHSSDMAWAGTHRLWGVEETMRKIETTLDEHLGKFRLLAGDITKMELPEDLKKISLLNIDVDMYEPTLACMQRFSPYIPRGGIILCEDASSTPGLYGAMTAMEDFLVSPSGKRFIRIFKSGHYFLIAMD